MSDCLPAKLEVSGLIRVVQATGGFAMVLHKGEPEAGTLLVVTTQRGAENRAFERMPSLDGTRSWHCSKAQDPQDPAEFDSWVRRRIERDPDLWVLEIDSPDAQRLIGA